jgi:hypothetical protein
MELKSGQKQYRATIYTVGGKKFSFNWSCPVGSLMSSNANEIFLLQDEFCVKETPLGECTWVCADKIDCYSLKPMKDMD